MRIRVATLTAMTVALLMGTAAPALAHEEINPKSLPTGSPAFLILTAANEAKADLTKVVLTAPSGVKLGETTKSPAGWTADLTETSITWSGGKVAADAFEQFGFEVEAPGQPGTVSFTVAMTAGAAPETVTVPLTVVAAGASTPTTVAPSSGTTVTSAQSTTVTTASAGSTVAASDVKSAKDKASTATVLAIVAIVVAVLALAASVVRGRRTPSPATPAQDF